MSPSAGIAPSPTGAWVWLFPLAYGLHIAEEYAFHFPAYVANVSGRHISNSQFLLLNAVFWLLTVAAIAIVRARPSRAWLVITLAAVLCINAVILSSSERPVRVGRRAVIGANSVVTESVPDGEIWAGVPARKVGDR